MKDLKMKYKHIIFISIMVSLFNFFIEPTSIFGLISIFMFFFYILGWINYIIYTLTKKDTKNVHKVLSELYFTIMLIASILLFLSYICAFSYGKIISDILYFIIAPYIGIRFLVRPLLLWVVIVNLLNGLFVFIIRKMCK